MPCGRPRSGRIPAISRRSRIRSRWRRSELPSESLSGVALVTGGGRGVGRAVATELAACGMRVAVTGRTAEQVEAAAGELDGLALTGDVSRREDVERWVDRTERELGPIDLLVANAGIAAWEPSWDNDPDVWWRVLEVNVRGVHLSCLAVLPGMTSRRGGRIVITGSGASYLPGSTSSAYGASKAAVGRFGEILAGQVADAGVRVFVISPGLVRTDMTSGHIPDDAPWTPPECAPRLVAALATGRLDALAGRYLHAEHDPPERLEQRIDAILADDLNAIRLRREPT